ncbi:MAG: hypothetical protein Ta2B_05870 [Termitinemataceae bacterium]|nr:MAG: hypothetical protein Ta2B_05870 [Termitinemataceae bacterium]
MCLVKSTAYYYHVHITNMKVVKIVAAFVLFLSVLSVWFPAGAHALDPTSDAPALNARSAILMDAVSGMTLFAKNADEAIPPASLTKLMTIYVAMREASLRGISLDSPVKLPPESWAKNQPPRSSLMFLAQGQIVSLRELFLGLAIPSGNDAAVAVALNFSPSIDDFAALMNREALKIGLRSTNFVEPSGISEINTTTAREFAIFCKQYIKDYPQNLQDFHSVREFAYPKPENLTAPMRSKPGTIVQSNHIGLLDKFEGVDGLKTGYIDEAGYNLAITSEQNGTRFVSVIMGVPASLGTRWGPRARDADGRALLEWAFKNYKTIKPEIPDLPRAVVWKGKKSRVDVVIKNDYGTDPLDSFTIMADRGTGAYRWEFSIKNLVAPFDKGKFAGTLTLFDDQGELETVSLVTTDEVERANFFVRAVHSILMFFMGTSKY